MIQSIFYLEARFEISEHGFNLVWPLSIFAEAGLANDWHAGIIGNLFQRLSEISQSIFSDCSLRGKARNGPLPDFNACEELLAPHVPDTLIWQCLLLAAASILKLGRWQNSTSDFHQAVADVQAEFLDVGVVVEIGFADETVDFTLSVRRRSGSGFDHCRRLHVRQLLDAPLTLDNVADLEWKIGVFVLLTNLQTGQVRVAKFHFVLVQKVLGNGAFNSLKL